MRSRGIVGTGFAGAGFARTRGTPAAVGLQSCQLRFFSVVSKLPLSRSKLDPPWAEQTDRVELEGCDIQKYAEGCTDDCPADVSAEAAFRETSVDSETLTVAVECCEDFPTLPSAAGRAEQIFRARSRSAGSNNQASGKSVFSSFGKIPASAGIAGLPCF